jgi:NADPH-dependent 2,4-dienoyl-CoA reductase/sulfur reductase-like enzyme
LKKLVIIGGSDAGISAALRARETDPGLTPTIIVADEFPNYSICGLPYYISRDVVDWKNLAHRTKEEIEREGINLMLRHTARSIDTRSKQVSVTDQAGATKLLDYDRLIIATGAESVRPKIPGIDAAGVFFLRWMPDCFAIDGFITGQNPKTALIIGAGFIGMEMSEALMKRGLQVTVVEFAESVMPTFSPGLGIKIAEALTGNGVAVRNNVAIESIVSQNGKLAVRGTNGFKLTVDMVLVSVGAAPGTELGRSIGMETGIKGAFKVNRRMETDIPDIFAAGDCAETYHGILRKNVYMPLGTVAHKQGRVAGENAAGGNCEFAGYFGTQSVKIFDRVIAKTGLIDREAKEAGFDPVSADFETWDHKVYYPHAEKLFIRVSADKSSKRILGAEMIGAYKSEVSKRIDIFASAIFHQMTVREFSDYDLSYTPPLSSPWDPVQMAVHKLERML